MRPGILSTVALAALAALAGGATSLLLRSMGSGSADEPESGLVVRESSPAARERAELRPVEIPTGRVLPDSGSGAFAADELTALARTDPRAAIQAAQALAGHWHRLDAIERVIGVWAERSPLDALAAVQRIVVVDPQAKAVIRSRLLEHWVAADGEAVLSYLLSREGRSLFVFDPESVRQVADRIASERPYAIISAAEPLSKGVVRTELRRAAIATLVESDLDFALQQARIEAPGPDRAQWVRAIEGAYARQDPAAALAWARQYDSQLPGTLQRVVTLVRELHPGQSAALGLCELDSRSERACTE